MNLRLLDSLINSSLKENSTNDCINICPKREKFLIPEKKNV